MIHGISLKTHGHIYDLINLNLKKDSSYFDC